MSVVLLLNGEPPAPDWLRTLAASRPVYAADGGARACRAAGIAPVKVVGDFDSVSPDDLPPEWDVERVGDQNSTDFEKVVRALPAGVDDVWVVGGFGKRLDHLVTNLLIATALPESWALRFADAEQTLWRVTPACPWTAKPAAGTTLSLLPICRSRGVSTEGLQWNLHDAEMGPGMQLGQSNKVTGPVSVRVEAGNVFIWMRGS